MCETMCLKLNGLGIHGQAFSSLNYLYLTHINNSDHLSIIISHSGNNENLINIINELKKCNLKTISISSPFDNKINNICQKHISLFFEQGFKYRTIQYTLSLQYILYSIYINLLNEY